jgi:hypothetical protein
VADYEIKMDAVEAAKVKIETVAGAAVEAAVTVCKCQRVGVC